MDKKEEMPKKDEVKNEEGNTTNNNKGGILTKNEKKTKKRKSVNWDIKNLEENELQNKLHPVTMKITEPKTPYTAYEEGDDEYFNKLNEVNKTKPTEDVLAQVINTLEKIPEKKDEPEEECMQIEVIEKDGSVTKKFVKPETKDNKEFAKKKKMAYHNEYAKAKEFMMKNKDIDNDEELIKKTMENTLANKYVGLIDKKINKE